MRTLREIFKDKEWDISHNWLPPELKRFKETVVNVDGCAVLRCGICGKSPLSSKDYHYYGVDDTPICTKCWKFITQP